MLAEGDGLGRLAFPVSGAAVQSDILNDREEKNAMDGRGRFFTRIKATCGLEPDSSGKRIRAMRFSGIRIAGRGSVC